MLGTDFSYGRELDRLPGDRGVPGPADPAPILGTWANTNRSTWGISRAELTPDDGGVTVRLLAADPPGTPALRDWGQTTVATVFTDGPGSGRVCGYTAGFDLGHARTQVQANVNHGLTVIAAFTTFTDGSGRLGYLSREFFHRHAGPAAAGVPPAPPAAGSEAVARGDDRLPMLRATLDPGPLLHRWRNADQTSTGIAEIGCELRDDRLFVRVVAVGPHGPLEWGEVPATVFTDISATGGGRAYAEPVTDGRPTPHYADVSTTEAGPAFWATYDHGFQRVQLQARINLGVLVVAMFTEFADDSGRAHYFHREVFVRDA